MGIIAVGYLHQIAVLIAHGGEMQVGIVEHTKNTARCGANLAGQRQHFLLVFVANMRLLAQQFLKKPLIKL